MSVACFTITQFGITILTDGLTYTSAPDRKISSTDSPKVWKLSPEVALTWMGSRTTNIDEIVSSLEGRTDPEGIISEIHEILEKGLSEEALKKIDKNGTGISTLSYQNGVPTHYELRIKDSKFNRHTHMYKPPTNACIMAECDNPGWSKFLRESSQAVIFNSGDPIKLQELITRKAFENMLEHHKDNKFVGGKIFMETIPAQI